MGRLARALLPKKVLFLRYGIDGEPIFRYTKKLALQIKSFNKSHIWQLPKMPRPGAWGSRFKIQFPCKGFLMNWS
jgi:hypothetical protein